MDCVLKAINNKNPKIFPHFSFLLSKDNDLKNIIVDMRNQGFLNEVYEKPKENNQNPELNFGYIIRDYPFYEIPIGKHFY